MHRWLFFSAGVNVNLLDNNERSVAFHLIDRLNHRGFEMLMETSLNLGNKVFLNEPDITDQTPLFLALNKNQDERKKYHQSNKQKITIISQDKQIERYLYKSLLFYGANPMISCTNEKSKLEMSPLSYTLQNELYAAANDLCEFGAELTTKDIPVLCDAVLRLDKRGQIAGHLEGLLSRSNLSKSFIRDERGNTPLHIASQVKRTNEIFDKIYYFAREWRLVTNDDGLIPLEIVIQQKCYRLAKRLLRRREERELQLRHVAMNNESMNNLYDWIYDESMGRKKQNELTIVGVIRYFVSNSDIEEKIENNIMDYFFKNKMETTTTKNKAEQSETKEEKSDKNVTTTTRRTTMTLGEIDALSAISYFQKICTKHLKNRIKLKMNDEQIKMIDDFINSTKMNTSQSHRLALINAKIRKRSVSLTPYTAQTTQAANSLVQPQKHLGQHSLSGIIEEHSEMSHLSRVVSTPVRADVESGGAGGNEDDENDDDDDNGGNVDIRINLQVNEANEPESTYTKQQSRPLTGRTDTGTEYGYGFQAHSATAISGISGINSQNTNTNSGNRKKQDGHNDNDMHKLQPAGLIHRASSDDASSITQPHGQDKEEAGQQGSRAQSLRVSSFKKLFKTKSNKQEESSLLFGDENGEHKEVRFQTLETPTGDATEDVYLDDIKSAFVLVPKSKAKDNIDSRDAGGGGGITDIEVSATGTGMDGGNAFLSTVGNTTISAFPSDQSNQHGPVMSETQGLVTSLNLHVLVRDETLGEHANSGTNSLPQPTVIVQTAGSSGSSHEHKVSFNLHGDVAMNNPPSSIHVESDEYDSDLGYVDVNYNNKKKHKHGHNDSDEDDDHEDFGEDDNLDFRGVTNSNGLSEKTIGKKRNDQSGVEIVYSILIEAIAAFDLITDAVVVYSLWRSSENFYTSVMVLSMFAPYFCCYTAFGSLLQYRGPRIAIKDKKSRTFCLSVISFLLLTPFSILYFVFIDILFLVNMILSVLIYVLTYPCLKKKPKDLVESVFAKVLRVNFMQILGYRCRYLDVYCDTLYNSICLFLYNYYIAKI